MKETLRKKEKMVSKIEGQQTRIKDREKEKKKKE